MARYSCEVDWLSIVLPIVATGEGREQEMVSAVVESTIRAEVEGNLLGDLFSELQPLAYGRAPYTFGWQDAARGLTIWAGGEMPHITIEFSGRGMAYLRETGKQVGWVRLGVERASRFDLAVDLELDTSPQVFVSARKEGRTRTNAKFDSPSGQTIYVGSRHSERYMRVYRYNAPHPRSHLLRLETVFKRSYAKQACLQALEVGLDAVAKTTLEEYGFSGMVAFDESVQEANLSVYRPERNMGKTLRWLITQVAPAFKKLCADGTIPDAEAFLNSYFLPEE